MSRLFHIVVVAGLLGVRAFSWPITRRMASQRACNRAELCCIRFLRWVGRAAQALSLSRSDVFVVGFYEQRHGLSN
jgi:hypothetical protein